MANSIFSKEQIMPLAVKLIGIAGGALSSYGVVTAEQVSTLQAGLPIVVGFGMVLYNIIYSLWANRKEKQIATVKAMPEVTGLQVSSQVLADKVNKIDPVSTTVTAQ